MKKVLRNIVCIAAGLFFAQVLFGFQGEGDDNNQFNNTQSVLQDTSKALRFPIDHDPYPLSGRRTQSPLYLNDPSNFESEIIYNPETNSYEFSRKVGQLNYRPPASMSFDEYRQYELEQSKRQYWNQRARGQSGAETQSFIPAINFGGEAFSKVFGSNTINIVPRGQAELIFGVNVSRVDNPILSEKLRRTPSFTFDEHIQMDVSGNIGDKFELGISYDTKATFDFENKIKLDYSGKEDEILKKVEAGNVTLPLTGSLITGSQSLFGIKTEMQFGKLTVTNVFSQQKGETSVIDVEGGAQTNEFEVSVIDYEANRHFFLSHYFKENYDGSLQNLPAILSNIRITKIEVWVTNKSGDFSNARNIVALMDLAESGGNIFNDQVANDQSGNTPYPFNRANSLFDELASNSQVRNLTSINTVLTSPTYKSRGFVLGQDYEKIESARLLSSREYSLNERLGYISLNSALNADEVLAVAFEYEANGQTFRVGELSTSISSPDVLIVKLIKGTNLTPKYYTWDLMMKNIYPIGAYQVNREDFVLNILYQDDQTGTPINYIKEGKIQNQILLKVMGLDKLNSQNDPKPDGVFDFYDGFTINASNGRVIFPVREPFGEDLYEKITGYKLRENEDIYNNNAPRGLDKTAKKYVFQQLYDSTQTVAKQIAEKNKFLLKGRYKSSSSSEIMLNAMNVPRGSVKVTAGGRQLEENLDYTVDYTLGRVKIINQGLLESGQPVRISLESHSLFNIQTKTMIGTHMDYRFSDDFNIGATMLRLTETPLTKKVNIGDEPISNTIWGLNAAYKTESQFLTTMVDKLPFIETKEKSNIIFNGEFAQLVPGQSKAISKTGISYIDDFEGTETSIEMKSYHTWKLASAPQGLPNNMFPESSLNDTVASGFNRAKMAWYTIDPLFLRNSGLKPQYRDPNEEKSHYVREIAEEEIFPEKDKARDMPANLNVLNVAYYPKERGPYNFDLEPTDISAGLDENGYLSQPSTRWGAIMRDIYTNDFEAANVEYIEFWLMDPFVEAEGDDIQGGKLSFHLGNVSEDILKDGRKSFENGLPVNDEGLELVDETSWGRVPLQQSYVDGFNADEDSRDKQDVGLDGLSDEDEKIFFQDFYNGLLEKYSDNPEVIERYENDISQDNFHYYRGDEYDEQKLSILERYKNYNGTEGNSPAAKPGDLYAKAGDVKPDKEDINGDNTLSENESFYIYTVDISPEALQVGQNYITNKVTSTTENQHGDRVNWYQFKIPVKEFQDRAGNIQDFKSIRFMRMMLSEWEDSVIMRFARLELVRSEWRKYELAFNEAGEDISAQDPFASFEISSVNIEENATRDPVNYVLPLGIDRVTDPTNPQLQQLNEQSIVLKVQELADGDARAAFKNTNIDIRQYKKLKMEVHAEAIIGSPLEDGEVTAFIRLGTDYTDNYYEYEVPLELTPHNMNYFKGDNTTDSARLEVWPRSNRFDIDLDIFQRAKQARNDAMRQAGSNVGMTTVYSLLDETNRVSVVGNPNLSNVKVIMIGVRNPGNNGFVEYNDGYPKSVEVWMNELRLTNFKDKGGWAATGRVQTKLADFGVVTLAGNTIKPGFGSIEKKVNDRAKEEVYEYDISANLELGKFFPEKSKITIPMYVGYSQSIINPEYNPLDKDIPLQAALDNAETKAEKDSIKDISQDKVTRKSLNFTNVKINKTEGQAKLWSVSNFAASYAYNQIERKDINTEYDYEHNHRGGISYIYNNRPKNYRPLNNLKALNSPYFRIIKDFNFYLFPSKISFRTDLDRFYNEVRLRNIENPNYLIETTAERDFLWNRYYDIKWDLARSLMLDYSATNYSRIDENEGYLLLERDTNVLVNREEWRDDLVDNLQKFGRNVSFNQKLNVSYTAPINKIPLLNWMTLNGRYSASYDWEAGPQLDTIELGNIINNSNSITINNNNNFINLYNKVPYLKQINQKYRSSRGRSGQKKIEYEDVVIEKDRVHVLAGRAKSIEHRLKTEDVEVKVTAEDGTQIPVDVTIVDENKLRIVSETDQRDLKVVVTGKREKKPNPFVLVAEHSTRTLMSVENLSISYSERNNSTLAGFMPKADIAGMSSNSSWAPGYQYAFGWADKNFMEQTAPKNGWLTTDTLLSTPYFIGNSQNLNIKSLVKPFNSLRIDLTGNWEKRTDLEQSFSYDETEQYGFDYPIGGMKKTGSMRISVISLSSAFEKYTDENRFKSETFDQFKENRRIIAERLRDDMFADSRYEGDKFYEFRDSSSYYFGGHPIDTDSLNFPYGFGPTSQNVLIPAFIAAYLNKDPNEVDLDAIVGWQTMLPNWRINFDGLSNLDLVKKYFRSINLTHSYRSTYSVGSYRSNAFYQREDFDQIENGGLSYYRNSQGNFETENIINAVAIDEQFSPLIGIDLTFKNSLSTRFEIKKSRNLTLSLSNNQLTELKTDELVFGMGYRFDEVKIVVNQRPYESDLNVRLDFSYRDNLTILRFLAMDERRSELTEPTGGQKILSYKLSADYVLSDRFNLRFFYNRDVNTPYLTNSYPTANTNVGFSVTFTLTQ